MEKKLPTVDLAKLDVSETLLKQIPRDMCERRGIFPVELRGSTLIIAVHDVERSVAAVDDVQFMTGYTVEVATASASKIQEAIELHYGPDEFDYPDIFEDEDLLSLDETYSTFSGLEKSMVTTMIKELSVTRNEPLAMRKALLTAIALLNDDPRPHAHELVKFLLLSFDPLSSHFTDNRHPFCGARQITRGREGEAAKLLYPVSLVQKSALRTTHR